MAVLMIERRIAQNKVFSRPLPDFRIWAITITACGEGGGEHKINRNTNFVIYHVVNRKTESSVSERIRLVEP